VIGMEQNGEMGLSGRRAQTTALIASWPCLSSHSIVLILSLGPCLATFSQEIARNPFSLKSWLRYLNAKTQAKPVKRYLIYERALKFLPGSYKLWWAYLQVGVVGQGREEEEKKVTGRGVLHYGDEGEDNVIDGQGLCLAGGKCGEGWRAPWCPMAHDFWHFPPHPGAERAGGWESSCQPSSLSDSAEYLRAVSGDGGATHGGTEWQEKSMKGNNLLSPSSPLSRCQGPCASLAHAPRLARLSAYSRRHEKGMAGSSFPSPPPALRLTYSPP